MWERGKALISILYREKEILFIQPAKLTLANLIKDAIGYAREENGLSRWFDMDAPATADRIRNVTKYFINMIRARQSAVCKPHVSLSENVIF